MDEEEAERLALDEKTEQALINHAREDDTMTAACDTERLRAIFDRGLSGGLGNPDGQVCIEAAIALACGGGLSDSPPCVAAEDRAFSICINDALWPSPQARADALWPLALAQIGTAGSTRSAWVERVVKGTIRRVVPIALRRAANAHPDAHHAAALRAAAQRCEDEGTIESVLHNVILLHNVIHNVIHNASTCVTYTVNAAAYNANANAAKCADYATRASACVARAADADFPAVYTESAAKCAARAAADMRWVSYEEHDAVLKVAVQVALDAYAAEGRHEGAERAGEE